MIFSNFINLNIFETDPVIAWAMPGFVLLIGLELLLRQWEHFPAYDGKDSLASISMGIGSAIINLFMNAMAFGVFWKIYETRFFTFQVNAWYSWVVLFFFGRFGFLHASPGMSSGEGFGGRSCQSL